MIKVQQLPRVSLKLFGLPLVVGYSCGHKACLLHYKRWVQLQSYSFSINYLLNIEHYYNVILTQALSLASPKVGVFSCSRTWFFYMLVIKGWHIFKLTLLLKKEILTIFTEWGWHVHKMVKLKNALSSIILFGGIFHW